MPCVLKRSSLMLNRVVELQEVGAGRHEGAIGPIVLGELSQLRGTVTLLQAVAAGHWGKLSGPTREMRRATLELRPRGLVQGPRGTRTGEHLDRTAAIHLGAEVGVRAGVTCSAVGSRGEGVQQEAPVKAQGAEVEAVGGRGGRGP
eukprot:jgi/Mesen1/1450/ME000132S00399